MGRIGLLVVVAALGGCSPRSDETGGDACARASTKLSACGVLLPIVQDENHACVGVRRLASECVVAHADGCDELATLFQRIDACMADLESDGGDPLSANVPFTFHDAGPVDGRAHDATSEADR